MANETLYAGIDRSIEELQGLLGTIDVDVKDKDVAKAQEAAKKAVSNYSVETGAETELSEDIQASGSAKITPIGRAAEGSVGVSGKEGETEYGLGAGGGVDLHADEGKGLGLNSSASANLAGFSFSISNSVDFVVYTPEVDKKTGRVTVRATLSESEGSGKGASIDGVGASVGKGSGSSKALTKIFEDEVSAQAWFDQSKEAIVQDMTGVRDVQELAAGEVRTHSTSRSESEGVSLAAEGIRLGQSSSSSSGVDYREKAGEDGLLEVQITVRASSSESKKVGSGSILAGVDLKGGESESETQSFQFSLNREAEEFDTLYALLQDADTQDKLEKLRGDSRFQQGKRKVQAEDKQTGEVKAKVGIGSVEASLGVSSRNDSDALITEEGEDLSGIFSGDDKGSFKVGVLGQKANVDWGTDADVDIDASGNRSADFSDEVKVGGLFKFLEKMANKLQGYKVSEADFKVIDQRASDTEKWGWCVSESDSLHKHWVKLGKQLVSPPTSWDWYEKEWESLDPRALRKLLAMAVVSDFMAKHGGDGGHEAWIRMLREWGVDPSGQQHGDAEDLGDAYEWQAEIKKEKALLAKCQKRVKMLPSILEKAVSAGKPDGARKKVKGLLKDLEKVRNGLEGFEDFDDKRAQAEMLARVDGLVDRVEDLEESHLSSEGAPGGKRAQGRMKRALKRLKSSKKQERALLKKLEKFGQWEDREKDQMKVRREGPLARPKVALEYRDKIANLFEHWVDEIEALRALYAEAGVPPEEWEISAQGSGRRDASHEPDVDAFLRLARTAEKKIPRSKPIEKRLAFLRRL